MRIGKGAADISMAGSAFMSDNNMAWAAFGNAAMIPFSSDKMSVEAGYMHYNPAKTNYINAGFSYNVKNRVGFTAGLSYGKDPSFDLYNDSGRATGTFSPAKMNLSAGVSWRFIDRMSAGLNLRYGMDKPMSGQTFSAFASDIVFMGRFADFSVSAGAMNLGTPVKAADGKKYSLASSAKVAAMYDKEFSTVHSLQVNADADYYFSDSFSAAFGAQYGWKDMVFVRAGYRYADKHCIIPSYASFGAGVKVIGIRLDLAYVTASDVIGNTFNIGIGYSF